MASTRLLVYGSYGYTGQLIVEHATETGHNPILAGRRSDPLQRQAADHDLDSRVFALEKSAVVEEDLETVDVVLNCAGPFSRTYEPLVDACIATGTDYLDITGEIEVFEGIAQRDEAATDAGVTLLPGVGFDVVPTDCLARHLADRLPDATTLELGFQGLEEVSPGTAHTVVDTLGDPGMVRRDGELVEVPTAHDVRTIDFGTGPTNAVAIPWGDVSTAYYTTGIPNVTVYAAQPRAVSRAMRRSNYLRPLLGSVPLRSLLHTLVDVFVDGPDEATRREATMYVWGRASDGDEEVVSRLRTPGSYEFTRRSAMLLARRTLDGDTPAGFQTPAGAFGADLVLEIQDVDRTDVAP